MKKCPYCKSDIQENARFCLYCMKSLDDKKPVSPAGKKRIFPFVLGAVLLVVLIVVLVCCAGGSGDAPTEQGKMTPDEAVTQATTTIPPGPETEHQNSSQPEQTVPAITEPQQTEPVITQPQPTQPVVTKPQQAEQEVTEPTTSQPKPTQSTTPEPTKPTNPEVPVTTGCAHRYQITSQSAATCHAEGQCSYTCSLCGSSYIETIPATGHSYLEATCLQPQICTVCQATGAAALGHSYQNGSCIRCQKPDPSDPKNIYEYRAARAGDQLPEGSYDPETDIVITGVKQIATDGVYVIPATIGGKRVVAICPLAFSGTDARKITLGKNVIYVAQNAFSGCYNVEALYVRPNDLFLSRAAFITASLRNVKLKIYCSAQCTVDDDLNGECFLKDIVRVYGAEYHEWNG